MDRKKTNRKKRLWYLVIGIILLFIMGYTVENTRRLETTPLGRLRQDTIIIDVESPNINTELIHQYEIEVELDDLSNQLYGKQKVSYINRTQLELKEIYFNIYANAFKERTTAPTLFNNNINSSDYQPGYIEFSQIRVNESKINYQISGMGETLLKIPLEESLAPGDSVEIFMEYIIMIPNTKERFGVSDGVYNLGNWYPVAAVYDERGWNLEPYYTIGDPFYSETSNYNVKIVLPKEMVLAASGNISNHRVEGNKGIWEVEAKLMRDFAWCSSKKFQLEETMVGDTVVKMYFLTKDSLVRKKTTEYTINSLKTFNKIFGAYPYGQYSVVATTFPSGMEYPGLVYIGQQFYRRDNLVPLELIIVHETAHQWWYGVVGNDQINEAWLDESLTTYSEVVYYREVYGEEAGTNHHQNRNEESYQTSKQLITDERILRPLSEFISWFDYGNLVYNQGARMLYALDKAYGKDKLYEILNTYYRQNQFKIATTKDFIKVCEDVLGVSKEDFFNKWLLGDN